MMKSSYAPQDVTLLLKDITGQVAPQSTQEREKLIQSGRHYCEMLPIEYRPTQAYQDAYQSALTHFAQPTARAIGLLADKILATKGSDVVLVSLARAGIPMGILLRRYLAQFRQIHVPHYAISIIRGRGIDGNAMAFLQSHHAPEQLLFVDGWTGKGAIFQELQREISQFPGVSSDLAVVADPANLTQLCGTHQDILIPSSCLNCTVSGLISRTFLRNDIISPTDFHGAVYYGYLAKDDISNQFLQEIQKNFQPYFTPDPPATLLGSGLTETQNIAKHYGISNINLVKPGIGEATRVLLRRVPWKVLINPGAQNDPALAHIFQLAKERNVPVELHPMTHYKVCGLIQTMADT